MMNRREYLDRLGRLAAKHVIGWHIERVRKALFWADDAGIPQVAAALWHPFSNSEQAALVVKAAEEE